MSLLHAHVYAARSCPCGMPIFMLHAHVCAACPCPWYVVHVHVCAAWTWTCSMDMNMQHRHGNTARTWACILDMDTHYSYYCTLRNPLLFRATVINVTFLKTVNNNTNGTATFKTRFKPINAWIQANVGGVPDPVKPESRCRLSMAHNWPRVLGIWNGEGLRKGRSVYEQLGAQVDGIAPR